MANVEEMAAVALRAIFTAGPSFQYQVALLLAEEG